MLSGEPGIGKTRLLVEFSRSAQAQGATVLWGGASQAAGMPPYLPFLEALGDYCLAIPPDQLRAEVGSHAAILATLFLEIPMRLGQPEAPFTLGHEQERFRLYEAVAAFLTAIAARAPLILLLDDLQWVDTASCDLLIHIVTRLRSVSLLIVGACRDGEADENAAFARALTELNRRRILATLPVHPLEAQESEIFVTRVLRGPVAPEATDLLRRQGEGNPYFLEELIRALAEEGTLTWRDGCWALASPFVTLLPPRIAEAIRMRLARLDAAVIDLLRIAAVVGRVYEPTLLALVASLDVERTEELLLIAVRAQLVRQGAEGAFAFAHDMVRETLYADVGSIRRRKLHQAIGEALEAHPQADSTR
jgi:predicted ATPase